MQINSANSKFNSLCLILSCGCNLECKYCYIAKSKQSKDYAASLQKNTIQALKDGSFLNNVQKTYDFFEQDLNTVENLSFWGQEPTLTLKYFTENLEDWCTILPNWKALFFSTNGVNNSIDIADFIIKLDSLITQKFDLTVQISYDGEWSCLNQRGVSAQTIKNNYQTIIEKLNTQTLNYVHANFHFHGVLSFENIERMNSYDDIFKYYKDFDDLVIWAESIIKNPNVSTDFSATINMESPYPASTFDGIKAADFIKKSLRLNDKDFKRGVLVNSMLRRIVGDYNVSHGIFDSDLWIKMLENTLDPKENQKLHHDMGHIDENSTFLGRMFCGSYRNELKIMYDGTVIGCQNYIYNTDLDHLEESDKTLYSIKSNLAKHNVHFNVLKDSNEKNIKKVLRIFDETQGDTFKTSFHSMVNLMTWLAECNQIDLSYKGNPEKILRHSLILTLNNSCFYNNLVASGSHYIKDAGYIRLYCNGVLDEVDRWIKGHRVDVKEGREPEKNVKQY